MQNLERMVRAAGMKSDLRAGGFTETFLDLDPTGIAILVVALKQRLARARADEAQARQKQRRIADAFRRVHDE